MSRLSVHLFKDLKAQAENLPNTDYEDFSVFCKFDEEYFTEEIAQEFIGLLNSARSVSNSFSIDLRDNAFTDSHIRQIAEIIRKHTEIKELLIWLPDNHITDEGAIPLISALDELKNIRSLIINLEWNFRISNKTLQALCKRLPSMSQLKFLKVMISK